MSFLGLKIVIFQRFELHFNFPFLPCTTLLVIYIMITDCQANNVLLQTAIDVIHRIQWDNSLNSDDFIVGYIDRFRGILEKPFSDFAWKDMAEIDYIEDFGVPQHRIQYFKWNSIIVWNKEARVDYIFGSAEGNGKKITDIIADACT